MTINDYKNRIKKTVKDEYSYLSDEDLALCLENGITKMSRDLPIIRNEVITGDGGNIYVLPSGWENGFSYIQAVEYPLENICPELLEEDYYRVLDNDGMFNIEFSNYNIPSGLHFRVYFAIRYKLTEENNTVPTSLSNPLINISASFACLMLAEKTVQFQDVNSGLIKFSEMSQSYKGFATDFRKLYENIIFNKALDNPEKYLVKGYSTRQRVRISKTVDNVMFHI